MRKVISISAVSLAFTCVLCLAAGHTNTGHCEATECCRRQPGRGCFRQSCRHVNIGLEKVAGKGVTVELCSPDWKMVLASTKR